MAIGQRPQKARKNGGLPCIFRKKKNSHFLSSHLIICRAHPDHFPKAVHNLLPSPLMTCQTSLRRWIWPMEKMPHGEHRTPVQSRQLLRHTSAVAQSWHDPVAEKWGERVRQVLRRERIRKVKSSFTHYWSAREYADDISIMEEVGSAGSNFPLSLPRMKA
jgi:hypothetical protein